MPHCPLPCPKPDVNNPRSSSINFNNSSTVPVPVSVPVSVQLSPVPAVETASPVGTDTDTDTTLVSIPLGSTVPPIRLLIAEAMALALEAAIGEGKGESGSVRFVSAETIGAVALVLLAVTLRAAEVTFVRTGMRDCEGDEDGAGLQGFLLEARRVALDDGEGEGKGADPDPDPRGTPTIGGEGVAARRGPLVDLVSAPEEMMAARDEIEVAEARDAVADGTEARVEEDACKALAALEALVGTADDATTPELVAGHITAGVYTGMGSVVP